MASAFAWGTSFQHYRVFAVNTSKLSLPEIDPNEAKEPREMTQAAPAAGAPAPVQPVIPANLPPAPPPQAPQQRNIPRRAPQDPEAQARRHAAIKRGLSMSQQGKTQTQTAVRIIHSPYSPLLIDRTGNTHFTDCTNTTARNIQRRRNRPLLSLPTSTTSQISCPTASQRRGQFRNVCGRHLVQRRRPSPNRSQ